MAKVNIPDRKCINCGGTEWIVNNAKKIENRINGKAVYYYLAYHCSACKKIKDKEYREGKGYKEKYREYCKEWRSLNKDKTAVSRKKYAQNHREVIRKKSSRWRHKECVNLTDDYIKRVILQQYEFRRSDICVTRDNISPEQIEKYKQYLTALRALKTKQYENNR